MTCDDVRRLAATTPEGDLPGEVRDHVATCPACAEVRRDGEASTADGSSRRRFLQGGLGTLAAIALAGKRRLFAMAGLDSPIRLAPDAPVEYIIVGSGAGGGPLACNLARAGHKVVLFEAGGNNYPFVANVPLFTGPTSEDQTIRWDYWVRHYGQNAQQALDSKYDPGKDPDGTGGIWYPRVGAVGGCTIHSFLFAIYPSDSDWDHIASLTGDKSWRAQNMRPYFERLERCGYVPQQPGNPSGHGYAGWQPTNIASPSIYANDTAVQRFIRAALNEVYNGIGKANEIYQRYLRGQLDPNDARVQNSRDGFYNVPAFMANGMRRSPRDYILQTQQELPDNLIVKTDCLVTRVLFDNEMRATGVEYREGARLYRADPNASAGTGVTQTMDASREVILAAGAFNSPQLLKLSGIGPADELQSFGINVLLDRPGVGRNLQDRYEVGIVTETDQFFSYLNGCTYFSTPDDPCAAQFFGAGAGPYTTVGAYGAMMQTSDTGRAAHRLDPDLFIIGAAARFKGYYLKPNDYTIGYAELDINAHGNQHTWLILKAHTLNRAGTVKLRSADPRDTPIINFHYFDEGSDRKLEDLEALVDAIQLVQRANARVVGMSNNQVWPGPEVQSRDQIREFVRNEAWGHHASCTNPMGVASDPMAVVDSRFRVHGTKNLRIVDASVFPRIPGYFILTPIFMMSEKAADVILEDAQ